MNGGQGEQGGKARMRGEGKGGDGDSGKRWRKDNVDGYMNDINIQLFLGVFTRNGKERWLDGGGEADVEEKEEEEEEEKKRSVCEGSLREREELENKKRERGERGRNKNDLGI
ncbi:hypothetical protein E2C01_076390 [Portunus trituberculatus]|uniref:Uncharacterized protein n=1 Tax=Portunus trituberculatus TaxID=210409 RepID=A0A5B7IJN5_PORTR|nr:hypothetical protein [Portunus trituberculatus]